MATRKGINISGNYAAPHIFKCLVHICTLYLKRLKGRTTSYFTFFLKLEDHPTRSFNFGFILTALCSNWNLKKFKSKTKPF